MDNRSIENDDNSDVTRKDLARKELARRELARRKQLQTTKQNVPQETSLLERSGEAAQKYINEPMRQASLGFAQGLANIGPGTYNLGAKAANLIPGVNIEEKKGFHFAPETIPSEIGQIGSFFTPFGLLGAPSHIQKIPQIANAIKYASKIVGKSPSAIQKMLKGLGSETGKSIGTSALTGAVMSPEDQGTGAALGGLGAGIGSGLGYAIPKGISKSKNILNKLGLPIGQPGEETLQHLKYEDVAPSVEAAKRLETPLRPSEASRNPYIAGIEGKYQRTSEAAYESTKLGMERIGKEKESINNLLNTIYDKSTASKNRIQELYQKAYKWNLKSESINKLKEDPIISDAFDSVSKDSAWQRKMKEIPENNYAYLDKVRKEISDKENKLLRSGEKSKAAEYTDARNQLVDFMDSSVPDYAKARQEAQKSIIRSQIEKKLGTGEIKGTEFFKKIIKNDNKFDNLVKSLKNVPDAQKQLQDMKEAWHSLINIEKPSSASYKSESALNQARGSLQKVIEIWNKLTGKKKNVESVKFTRDMDKWVKRLQESKESGNKKHVEQTLSDIMGKILPGYYNVEKEGNE